jgi:hypothetical protein
LEVIKKAPTCPSTPRPFHPPGVTGDEDEGVNACEDDSFKKFKNTIIMTSLFKI